LVYLCRADTSENANTVAFQFFLDQAAERRVDCRQHRLRSAKKRNLETALGESIGHLKSDVARTDEDGRARISLRQESMDRETVIHCMQKKHTRAFASGELGSHGLGAGRDDQAIIANRPLGSGVHKRDGSVWGVDTLRRMSSQYVEARKFGAVSETMPVGRFAAEKIRQAAYAEVGIVILNKDRDFCTRVQFLGAKRGAYSGVAAPNDD
jgi:hypothetical protein